MCLQARRPEKQTSVTQCGKILSIYQGRPSENMERPQIFAVDEISTMVDRIQSVLDGVNKFMDQQQRSGLQKQCLEVIDEADKELCSSSAVRDALARNKFHRARADYYGADRIRATRKCQELCERDEARFGVL